MIESVATDWHINPQITFDEWKQAGQKLALIDNTLQWHWGEWWNHGHQKWERDAEEFIKTLPLKRKTLKEYGSIATLVKPSIRVDGLPFKHHQQVAPLHEEPKEQKKWLERALDNHWPASQLREAIKEAYKKDDPPLPEGEFNVIYADPPWKYTSGDQHTDTTQETVIGTHYESMTIAELCALQIEDVAATNCVLFLWVTSPLLQECFDVIIAWGFQYKTSMIWDKIKHNVGHYVSVRHELLLICTRGSFLPKDKTLHDSVVSIERTKHSEKPVEFRKIIEKMYGKASAKTHLELFARKKIQGWTAYGNEA